jgi:hypothetical protein
MSSQPVLSESTTTSISESGFDVSHRHTSQISFAQTVNRIPSVHPRTLHCSIISTTDSSLMMCVSSLIFERPRAHLAQEDAFGPFSDSAASGDDPFTFSPGLADDLEESGSFDDFGTFGDFQSAKQSDGDGQLTPTAESWPSSFTSASSSVHTDSSLSSLEEFGTGSSTGPKPASES